MRTVWGVIRKPLKKWQFCSKWVPLGGTNIKSLKKWRFDLKCVLFEENEKPLEKWWLNLKCELLGGLNIKSLKKKINLSKMRTVRGINKKPLENDV